MKIAIRSIIGHFTTVFTHKWWVFKFCCRCGIPWRGFIHDLSKFSPREFMESLRYYTPGESSIPIAKKSQGWSEAWLHHKHHNKHHYEYWTDNYDTETTCIRIPFIYATEMLCDWLAAGRTYQGKRFTYLSELDWWNKRKDHVCIHPDTRRYISVVLSELVQCENPYSGRSFSTIFNRGALMYLYENAQDYSVDPNIKPRE